MSTCDEQYRIFVVRKRIFQHQPCCVDIVTSKAIITLVEDNVHVYTLTDSVHANHWLEYYVDSQHWLEIT